MDMIAEMDVFWEEAKLLKKRGIENFNSKYSNGKRRSFWQKRK
jgi:hypothetical protein